MNKTMNNIKGLLSHSIDRSPREKPIFGRDSEMTFGGKIFPFSVK